jgi:hypothetical protein
MGDPVKCPFEDEDFILNINTPCPVCGMLGSFIYQNPGDDSCVDNAARHGEATGDRVSTTGEPK